MPAVKNKDKPEERPAEKPLCFVIGPIGKDGSEERKHADMVLNAVVKHVLESEEFGYRVKRADEDADPGMIGDRMITDIIHADLVVADLTGLNANAFYELGIRHSTEKPAIHIARAGTVLPFDNVAHRTIFVDLGDWHSIEAARKRLAESARHIKSPDFKVSNPITQANASFKMRESADPRDRLIADLQERMSRFEASQFQPVSRKLRPNIPINDLSDYIEFETSAMLGRGLDGSHIAEALDNKLMIRYGFFKAGTEVTVYPDDYMVRIEYMRTPDSPAVTGAFRYPRRRVATDGNDSSSSAP